MKQLLELKWLSKQLLEVLEQLDSSGYLDPDAIDDLNDRCAVLKEGIDALLELGEEVVFYKVESSDDDWRTPHPSQITFLTQAELKELAEYYYNNSDDLKEYNFNDVDVCIEYVRGVDKVDGITNNPCV